MTPPTSLCPCPCLCPTLSADAEPAHQCKRPSFLRSSQCDVTKWTIRKLKQCCTVHRGVRKGRHLCVWNSVVWLQRSIVLISKIISKKWYEFHTKKGMTSPNEHLVGKSVHGAWNCSFQQQWFDRAHDACYHACNATSERSFSAAWRIKMYLCSARMLQQHLNHLKSIWATLTVSTLWMLPMISLLLMITGIVWHWFQAIRSTMSGRRNDFWSGPV